MKFLALIGNYAAYSGNSLPTFRDNLSALSSRAKNARILGFLTDRLARNVGKELPFYSAQCPMGAHISSTSRRRPEITRPNFDVLSSVPKCLDSPTVSKVLIVCFYVVILSCVPFNRHGHRPYSKFSQHLLLDQPPYKRIMKLLFLSYYVYVFTQHISTISVYWSEANASKKWI
jgi:hypothetical protein